MFLQQAIYVLVNDRFLAIANVKAVDAALYNQRPDLALLYKNNKQNKRNKKREHAALLKTHKTNGQTLLSKRRKRLITVTWFQSSMGP